MGKCDDCPIQYKDFSPMSSQLPTQPIRVIKGDTGGKKYHVLRFNTPTSVKLDEVLSDNVTMKRIVTKKFGAAIDLEGEGSEFGWKSKQARLAHKYHVKAVVEDECPWELKDSGDKVYSGRKEGGITTSASYMLMKESSPGVYEAFPVEDWFTFTPKVSYQTLNAEEAEEQFLRRNKTQNYFSLMMQKRLNVNLGPQNEDDEFKIHDADEVVPENGLVNDDDDDDDSGAKKKKSKQKVKKKGEKTEDDVDHNEKSDEDNYDAEESHEVDYMSESDSESDVDLEKEKPDSAKRSELSKEVGVICADSESEEDDDNLDEGGKEMKKLLLGEDSEGDSEVDEDSEEFKALMLKKNEVKELKRSATPTNNKAPPNKKSRLGTPPASKTPLTEESVWRYLARKPISTKELITKFKGKKSGLSNKDIVDRLSSILKKIANQTTKDGMNYFVLKDSYKSMYKE